MFDWLSEFLSPVVDWVSGTAAGEAGAAIVGAALESAVVGGLSGALISAIKGEDVFKGALKGAAIGGAMGGIVSSLGQLSGMESFTAENQLKAMGFNYTPDTPASGAALPEFKMGDNTPVLDLKDTTRATNGLLSTNNAATTVNNSVAKPEGGMSKFFGSDSGGKVLAGIGQGAAVGLGNAMAAEEAAEANQKALEYKTQVDKDKIAANKAGDFTARTANITIKKWWDDQIAEDTAAIGKGTTPTTRLGVA